MVSEQSESPPPQPVTDAPGPQPDESANPAHTHGGNGKIARLPKKLRDQVGIMLLDGVPYAKIIEALGEHGEGILEPNLKNWKAYGFKAWLIEYERKEALRSTHEAALTILDQKAGPPVQDAGRTVAAAQLYELLQCFDPKSFATSVATKPELYLRLISSLARLSEGDAVCSPRRALHSLIEAKMHPSQESATEKLILSKEALQDIARQIKLL